MESAVQTVLDALYVVGCRLADLGRYMIVRWDETLVSGVGGAILAWYYVDRSFTGILVGFLIGPAITYYFLFEDKWSCGHEGLDHAVDDVFHPISGGLGDFGNWSLQKISGVFGSHGTGDNPAFDTIMNRFANKQG